MKIDLLKETLDVLYLVKEELGNNAESSTNQNLDEAIEKLETCMKNNQNINHHDLLILFGKALNKLPFIINLLEKFG